MPANNKPKKRKSRSLPTQAMIKRCAVVAGEIDKTIMVTREGIVFIDPMDSVNKNSPPIDAGEYGHL